MKKKLPVSCFMPLPSLTRRRSDPLQTVIDRRRFGCQTNPTPIMAVSFKSPDMYELLKDPKLALRPHV